MKKGLLLAASTIAAASFVGQIRAANLLSAPGFEAPAPSATTADQKLPGPFAANGATVAASQNPWFYGVDDTTKTGAYGEYSSDIPAFSGTTPSNRLNSLPTGATNGNYKANDGDQYAYAYSVGMASGQSTWVAQSVTGGSIVPGDNYNASAYFFMKNNTTGTGADGDRFQSGGSSDSLRLVFIDAAGTVISTAQSSSKIDNTTTPNTWTQLSFNAVAPANTATIVFEALLTRGSSGGVMFVDSANLNDVSAPEPTSLGLLAGAGMLLARRRRSV